jgi:hypothetical protein
VLAAVALGLAAYGLGRGGGFYHRLVAAPLRPDPAAPYYRASLLHVLLGHACGLAGSLAGFRVFVLAWYWAALARLAWAFERPLALADAALLLLVVATHPAAMIVHAWTCHPDALTMCFTAVLLYARRPALVAAVAALGACNHLAMWLPISAHAALLWWGLAEPRLRTRVAALALGLAAGAAGSALALRLADVLIPRGRLALAADADPTTLVGYWTAPGPAVAYTLHFAHVLWLPALTLALRREHPRAAAALLATQASALAATFFTQDTTRVFAVLAWAPPVYCLAHVLAGSPRGRLRWWVALGVLGSLVGPKWFAWKGALHDLGPAREHLASLLF